MAVNEFQKPYKTVPVWSTYKTTRLPRHVTWAEVKVRRNAAELSSDIGHC